MKFRVFAPATAVIAGLMTGLGASAVQAQEKRCEMRSVAELPVMLVGDRLMVTVVLDGKPARAWVNTSTRLSAINGAYAQAQGWRTKQSDDIRLRDRSGKVRPANTVTVKTFEFGGAVVEGERFAVIEGLTDNQADMILGINFWTMADIEFDVPNNRIRLFNSANCENAPMAYWGPDFGVSPLRDDLKTTDYFVVRVALNGKALGAHISASMQKSVVTTSATKAVGIAPEDGISRDAVVRQGKPVPTWEVTFPTFTLADETVSRAKLLVSDAYLRPAPTPLEGAPGFNIFDTPQMVLGTDFLRSHRLFFARSQKKLYFSYVGGPVFQVTGAVPQGSEDNDAADDPAASVSP